MKGTSKACAYCGTGHAKLEREHVVPSCLYPTSKERSRVQRITVPSCSRCNRGWSDDEAHFRNVLLVAGEPNAAVHELWQTTARRGFRKTDGQRRLLDLIQGMVPVTVDTRQRWMIYPGRDDRVLRVVRKIVRGLSHFHAVESAVSEDRVWTDVLKYQIPDELVRATPFHHRESDVIEYWYEAYEEGGLSSVWCLKFFERRVFVAAVSAEHHG
jgi:hypothetical protein